LQQAPNYKEVADKLVLQDLYREVAASANISVPDVDMKPFTLELDKVTFDPANPAGALAAYPGTKA